MGGPLGEVNSVFESDLLCLSPGCYVWLEFVQELLWDSRLCNEEPECEGGFGQYVCPGQSFFRVSPPVDCHGLPRGEWDFHFGVGCGVEGVFILRFGRAGYVFKVG